MNSTTKEAARKEKFAHRKWLELALAEESFLMQRSRVTSVIESDLNTSYFHRKVVGRKSRNQVHYLLDASGNRLEGKEAIQSHCIDFFSSTLGEALSIQAPHLKPHQDQVLQCLDSFIPLFLLKKSVVYSLPRNKTPGSTPDGYTAEFYQKTWDITGYDLTLAVKEFFSSGQMLQQWNSTVICLIPKKTNAEKVTDFRPISCCNVLYKIFPKFLQLCTIKFDTHRPLGTTYKFLCQLLHTNPVCNRETFLETILEFLRNLPIRNSRADGRINRVVNP